LGVNAMAPVFSHPDEVLSASDLTIAQKRAVLASWVSDARAVENAPSRRQLDNGAVVSLDALLQALKSLDAIESRASRPKPDSRPSPAARQGPRLTRRLLQAIALHADDNDDDDPPPSPACGALPPRLEFLEANARRVDGQDAGGWRRIPASAASLAA
jgi:hypothetical protein